MNLGRNQRPRRGIGWAAWTLALAVLLLAGWDPLRAPDPDVAAGNQAFERGAYGEARAAYERALARDVSPGDQAQLFLNLGAALYRQALARRGEPGNARERRADDAADASTDALLEAAEAAFRRALALAPDALQSVARYDLGNALAQRGRLDEAARAYRDALRADPANDDARYNLELVDRLRRRAAGQTGHEGRGDGQPRRPGGGQQGAPRGAGPDGADGPEDPGAAQSSDGTPGSGDASGDAASGDGPGDPGAGGETPPAPRGDLGEGDTPRGDPGTDAPSGAASGADPAATAGEGGRRGEPDRGGSAGEPGEPDRAAGREPNRRADRSRDSAPDYADAPRELDRKLDRLEQRSRELRRERLRRQLGRDGARDGEPPVDW